MSHIVGRLQTITCVAVRVQKPVRQVRKLSEGITIGTRLIIPWRLIN